MSIKIDDLASAVMKELENYEAQATAATKRAVEKTAEECRQDISNNATVFKGSKYAGSWRKKLSYYSAKENRYTIYSTKYQLTHLLEYGHEKWLWGTYSGSRVDARPHIRPAEERAEQRLISEIKRTL